MPKLTIKIKLYIVTAAVVIALASAYAFVFRGQISKVNALKDQAMLLESNFVKIKKDEAYLPKLEDQIIESKLKIAIIHDRMPAEYAIPEMVSSLSQLATKVGIKDYLAVTPGEPVGIDKYVIVPMKVSFQCRYSKLIEYLLGLENMTRLTRVDKMNLKVVENDPTTLSVMLEFSTFNIPESKMDAKSEPKK